jgi:hypothetical protein
MGVGKSRKASELRRKLLGGPSALLVDPLGLGPDTDPYRYVGNGPSYSIDPSGLEPTPPNRVIIRGITYGSIVGVLVEAARWGLNAAATAAVHGAIRTSIVEWRRAHRQARIGTFLWGDPNAIVRQGASPRELASSGGAGDLDAQMRRIKERLMQLGIRENEIVWGDPYAVISFSTQETTYTYRVSFRARLTIGRGFAEEVSLGSFFDSIDQ